MVKRAGGALLLSLELDRDADEPLSTQLRAALHKLLLSGDLQPGSRLPASRTLAQDLGVSRTTVIAAYDRLAAEGLIDCKVGAGSYVSDALSAKRPPRPSAGGASEALAARPPPRIARSVEQATAQFHERLPHQPRAFTTAMPAFDAFPLALWSRHVAKYWRTRSELVLGYGDPRGYWPLRRAIAAHLGANRGIACDPDQIFILGGAQEAFNLIGRILLEPGDKVWFENPGAIGARNSFVGSGAEMVPLPVDREGMAVAEGLRLSPDFRLAFVTPSHQQPLGVTMSLRRRFELLHAAEAADAWIVEDDYDGEFCYGEHPLRTLKSVDTDDRVIYVGTFSKTLFPALRLGYALVPPQLVSIFERVASAFLQGVPSSPQAVVADFMEQGHFAAHIRRMRKIYAERYRTLREAARQRLAGLLEVVPTETGLHTIGLLPDWATEEEVARWADRRRITVAPLERFCIAPIDRKGLVLGFSGVPPSAITAGVAILGEVLETLQEMRAERETSQIWR